MEEAKEEQQRNWRDEAGETFVNMLFAREGIMQARVQRHQEFEERLREKALNPEDPQQPSESMGGVSVGNKNFNFYGADAAGAMTGATDVAKKSGSNLMADLSKSTLPVLLGGAMLWGAMNYLTPDAGESARAYPAVEVRTGLKLPDGTVVPIRPELFDSTKYFPEPKKAR